MDLSSIYQRIILDAAQQSPKDQITNANVHLTNPTCGDDIQLAGNVVNHQLQNLQIHVDGCIICQAATTLMLNQMTNGDVDNLNNLVLNMSKMMTNEHFDEQLMGDLVAFKSIVHLPIRIKCAMLPFKGLYQLMKEGESHR